MKRIILTLTSITLFCAFVGGCNKTEQNPQTKAAKPQTMTVKENAQESSLFFNGVISPIKTDVVTTPVDGTVVKLYFAYGQKVRKEQKMIDIRSSTMEKNYQTAISGYLTAKEKYNTNKNNIVGAKNLYDAGITSTQTYQSAVSTLDDSYLSFIQAQQTLIKILQKANIPRKSIELLKIGDEAAVRKTLESPLKNLIIHANASGVALLPTGAASGEQSSGSGSNSDKALHEGSQVKSGQFLVAIGEMTGIKIKVNVGEININQINVGDSAKVTSAAFPGVSLTGKVTQVGRQANANEGGGLPTFPVSVSVKSISPEAQNLVHVGMSAKVEILVAAPKAITVPINAVKIKNNMPYVLVIDPKTGKEKQQPVKTGAATVDGVNIIEGLKPGDKIVYSH